MNVDQVKSVTEFHFLTRSSPLPGLNLLSLVRHSSSELARLEMKGLSMREKWLPFCSQGACTRLKIFSWLQIWMALGLLTTWYSGTD
jgi:hypothetical protein